MSTGVKVLLGCLGLVGVLAVVGAVGAFLLFNLMEDRTREFVGAVERQAEAQRVLERLEEEHPFRQPADGVVPDASARALFTVTEELWVEIEPWAEELADMARRMEDRDEPSISDLASGFQAVGHFAEGRALFAETLDRHDLSPREYLWTGLSLIRAYEELGRPEGDRTVPAENVELAERYRAELEELSRPAPDGRPGRGTVFHVAMVWGMGDGSAWRAMGLDTLSEFSP